MKGPLKGNIMVVQVLYVIRTCTVVNMLKQGSRILNIVFIKKCLIHYLTGPPRMPHEEPYVFELRPDSLKLQWCSVELPSRITDYSPVTYRLEIQELPRSDWMTLAKGIPHTDFNVTNLNPDKDYCFRVRAENDMGISDPTPVVVVKKRAGETIFKINLFW